MIFQLIMFLAERLSLKCHISRRSFASLPNIQFSDISAANIINRHTSHLKGVYLLNQKKILQTRIRRKNVWNTYKKRKDSNSPLTEDTYIEYAINLGLPWWLCFIRWRCSTWEMVTSCMGCWQLVSDPVWMQSFWLF